MSIDLVSLSIKSKSDIMISLSRIVKNFSVYLLLSVRHCPSSRSGLACRSWQADWLPDQPTCQVPARERFMTTNPSICIRLPILINRSHVWFRSGASDLVDQKSSNRANAGEVLYRSLVWEVHLIKLALPSGSCFQEMKAPLLMKNWNR
jgi:hypothetical protein